MYLATGCVSARITTIAQEGGGAIGVAVAGEALTKSLRLKHVTVDVCHQVSDTQYDCVGSDSLDHCPGREKS